MGASRGRRTGLILVLLIIIVLVIGVVGVVVLQRLGGGGGVGEEPTPVPTPTPPPSVEVIVALGDIARGSRIGLQDVTTIDWPDLPDAPPPANALIVGAGPDQPGLEQVEGRIARVDILDGQPILDHMLTPGDQPTSLGDAGSDAALLIPSGAVAMTIPITRLSSVGYALRQGDHVDIMMSFRFVDVDEDFQTILPNDVITVTDEQDLGIFQFFTYGQGRVEDGDGPFGMTNLIVPSMIDAGSQRPRQTTQMVVDNAIVLQLGEFAFEDIDQPIVITVEPEPVPVEGEEAPTEGAPAEAAPAEGELPTPTPIPEILPPDIITLVMSRQDALVLKYAIETGADIDLALRSALDDDQADFVTDAVTLQYIIDFYNVVEPPRLPIAQDPRIELFSFGDRETIFGVDDFYFGNCEFFWGASVPECTFESTSTTEQ